MSKLNLGPVVEREVYCKCGSYLKIKEPYDVMIYVLGQFWQYHSRKKCGLLKASMVYSEDLVHKIIRHRRRKK